MTRWRSIKTAPQDETVVDLWVVSKLLPGLEYRVPNCVWVVIDDALMYYAGYVNTDYRGGGNRYISTQTETVTHWMLPPKPPRTAPK